MAMVEGFQLDLPLYPNESDATTAGTSQQIPAVDEIIEQQMRQQLEMQKMRVLEQEQKLIQEQQQ